MSGCAAIVMGAALVCVVTTGVFEEEATTRAALALIVRLVVFPRVRLALVSELVMFARGWFNRRRPATWLRSPCTMRTARPHLGCDCASLFGRRHGSLSATLACLQWEHEMKQTLKYGDHQRMEECVDGWI